MFALVQKSPMSKRPRRNESRAFSALMTTFSMASYAYIRLSFAYSRCGSRSRVCTFALAPPYFDCQRK